LKVEKEKQEQLLKAEKEKQEQLLKAEKEKQEQLLKAEKEKQEQLILELGKKMLDNGQNIVIICNLLNITEAQLNQYCVKQSKI
jgi:regulator of protease activity HflC (stomatin/prohibitin superfamily)